MPIRVALRTPLSRSSDRISVYRDARVVTDVGNDDPCIKVGGGDAKSRDVENVLAASAIVVKIDDCVPSESWAEDEGVVMAAADQGIIASPADENVVAARPVKQVVSCPALEPVVTAAPA